MPELSYSPRFCLNLAGFCTALLDSGVVGRAGLLYESSGGNQVDGLPPVAHTGEGRIGSAPKNN